VKAVRVGEDGSVAVVEVAAPRPGPGEAVMRTRAAGICGSDLLSWYVRRKAGAILGHEVAGEIVEVGEGVAEFAPGDRVVPHHHAPCLACEACRLGRFVHCATWRSSALDPGGMAELVRIPAGNLARDTHKIPEGTSDEEASWTEPLATVVKALRRAGFAPGQSLLSIGLGSAGQLALRLAAARGASRLAGIDPAASRRRLAETSGAAAFETSQDAVARAARESPGGRGFDVVFVTPGSPDVMRAALPGVAPGGTLLLFTMAAPGQRLEIEPGDLYFREVSIVPSYSCGPDDTREALDLIARRIVRVDDLVTHRFPLERAAEAFARAKDPEGSLKVLLTFPEA
jgi:L-iditol 2-dehydrogenase